MEIHGKTISSTQLCFYRPELNFEEFLALEQNDTEFWTAYVHYCHMDCVSLFEIWKKFTICVNGLLASIDPILLGQCPLMSCNTIGSHSRKIFETLNMDMRLKSNWNHYTRQMDQFMGTFECRNEKTKELTGTLLCDMEKYRFLCLFKRGGISHCHQPGKHMSGITGVDIASQYPASLIYSMIPAGESFWAYEYEPAAHGFWWLKNVRFSGKLFKPVAYNQEGKSLNWATNAMDELYVDSYTLKYCQEHYNLDSFEVVKGLVSYHEIPSHRLFGRYINTFYAEKQRQDALKEAKDPSYNEALRSTIKLYLNSMSGKLVEGPHEHYSTKWNAESDLKLNGVGIQRMYKEEAFNRWLTAGLMVYSYSKRLLAERIRRRYSR
jgi:hypothetical protein